MTPLSCRPLPNQPDRATTKPPARSEQHHLKTKSAQATIADSTPTATPKDALIC